MHYLKKELLHLLESNTHFFSFFQESGLWIWDVQHPENYWISPNFWVKLGYETHEIPDLLLDWKKLIHPDDIALLEKELSSNLASPESSFDTPIRYLHKQGYIMWLRCRGMALRNEEGQVQLITVSHIDITNEKESELKARQQSLLYEYILNSQVLYVAKIDLEGRYTFISENYANALGEPVENLLDTLATTYMVAEDIDVFRQGVEFCRKNPLVSYTIQIKKRLPGKALQAYEWSMTGLEDSFGQVNEILGLGRDVTQTMRTEINLSVLLSSMSDILSMTTPEGVVTYLSPAWTKILGYPVEDCLGKTMEDFIHPDDLPAAFEMIGKVNEELPACFEHRIKHQKGHYLWMETKANRQEVSEEIVWTSHDIDKRKKAEEELLKTKVLLEETSRMAKVGAWEYNIDQQRLYWSDVTKEIHEIPLDENPDMRHGISFYATTQAKERLARVVAEGIKNGTAWDLEEQIITAKGNLRWVRTIGQVEQINGRSVRLFGTFQDIDDLKTAQGQIEKARQQAEYASSAKSEFLANMSHEIRTPLNGVIGFTELLLKTPLDETQQLYQKTVYESAHSLLGIINDILEFSKIEAGKLSLVIEKTELELLCHQSLALVTTQAQNKGLEVLLNIEPNVPRWIWVDELRLRQILVNLLSNAAKFTLQGEIELKVECLALESEQARLRFTVRDTGIGIEKENQRKIFEAFTQEDLSTTKKFGGTGLGLTISSRLLRLMNSQFELSSKLGKGSCFSFELSVPAASEDLASSKDWPHLNRIHSALVVDDNKVSRSILKQILAQQNIACYLAKNGIEALEVTQEQIFDVILMDYHMPFLNGVETLEKMRASSDQALPPVLIMNTIYEGLELEKSGKALLPKPVKRTELLTALSNLFEEEQSITPEPPAEPVSDTPLQTLASILVVEDNAVNRLLAKKLIASLRPELTIYEAHNGIEGVEAFTRYRPDLILMDIQMPEMNGYEATQQIRQIETGHIPILALTASILPLERERCLAAGMDDYLTKPIARTVLEQALEQWLPLPNSN